MIAQANLQHCNVLGIKPVVQWLISVGKVALAQNLLNAALDEFPNSVELLRIAIDVAMRRRSYALAVGLGKHLLQLQGTPADHLMFIRALLTLKYQEEANKAISNAFVLWPENEEICEFYEKEVKCKKSP